MSVIQDIIKNEGDPDSWPVDVHEYTRQQTLFWESYLLIFKYSFTEQLSVSRVWSSRGHCITTTRLGQVLVPDQHRSYLQTPENHFTKKLRLWEGDKGDKVLTPLCFQLNDAYSILPGCVLSLIGGCASRIPGPVCSRGNSAPGGRQNVCFHQ